MSRRAQMTTPITAARMKGRSIASGGALLAAAINGRAVRVHKAVATTAAIIAMALSGGAKMVTAAGLSGAMMGSDRRDRHRHRFGCRRSTSDFCRTRRRLKA